MSMFAALCCALLLKLAHGQPRNASDYRVEGLEDIEPAFAEYKGGMYAGTIPVESWSKPLKEGHGELMFWYFDTHKPVHDDTLVIWFNGGPGCSSFDAGLLFEIGPVTTPHRPAGFYGGVSEVNAPLLYNNETWSSETDVLFIEQPVGVGFSFGGTEPQTESDVARDFYGFLLNLYEAFPWLAHKRLYLVGESYAGMYVPAIAHYIYHKNLQMHNPRVNLAGIGLGNGWIDVTIQGPMVIDYAWWHGMIDSVTRDAFHSEWKHCLRTSSQPKPFHSFTVPDECGIMGALLDAAGANQFDWGAPNTYDITTWDKYNLIVEEGSTIERLFNNPEVQKKLHTPPEKTEWHGCIPGAGRRRHLTESSKHNGMQRLLHLLDNDQPVSMAKYIKTLLDNAKIDVLIYNGDRDMSTCSQGSEVVLNGMEWSGSDAWLDPDKYRRGLWLVENYPGGYAKEVKNLQFVTVYNSGHMVPLNVPVPAKDLIHRFLKGHSFIDRDLPVMYKAKASRKDDDDEGVTSGWVPIVVSFVVGACLSILVMCIFCGDRARGYERI